MNLERLNSTKPSVKPAKRAVNPPKKGQTYEKGGGKPTEFRGSNLRILHLGLDNFRASLYFQSMANVI